MIKLVALALIFAIVIVYLKSINSELSFLALICAGIIIVYSSLEYLTNTISFINQLVELSGIDYEFYKIIFKINAIGYLVEFGASTIEDFGLKSLADKLVFAGKIIILSISLPIIYAVFNVVLGLVS